MRFRLDLPPSFLPGLRPWAGLTRELSSACTLPRQGAHPLSSCLLLLTHLLPRCLLRPRQERGGALLGQASDTRKCPGVSGQGCGSRGGRSWPRRPSPPARPFPGRPAAQGVLTGRWADTSTSWAGSCGRRPPPSWKPQWWGEGSRRKQRKGDHHGPLESSQGGQMPDAGHQLLCPGNGQAGWEGMGVGCQGRGVAAV